MAIFWSELRCARKQTNPHAQKGTNAFTADHSMDSQAGPIQPRCQSDICERHFRHNRLHPGGELNSFWGELLAGPEFVNEFGTACSFFKFLRSPPKALLQFTNRHPHARRGDAPQPRSGSTPSKLFPNPSKKPFTPSKLFSKLRAPAAVQGGPRRNLFPPRRNFS